MKTSSPTPRLSSRRGSVLIVALLLAGGVALCIGSYIAIARTNLNLSHRAFYNNAAMNLAETGLEEAIWSINRNLEGDSSAWTDWKIDGSAGYRTFGPFDVGQNTQGFARVYVSNTTSAGSAPVIVTRSTITPTGSSTSIEKWVSVTLRKRSKFANGLVAKDKLLFKGNNASVDSWNSNPSGTVIPYSASVRNDNGSAGSISVSVDSVLIQNADIWGYVATGGTSASNIVDNVGTGGSILGEDSAAKDKTEWESTKVDPDRVSADFTSDLDPVTAPTNSAKSLGGINSTITLPEAGDTPDADGNYYYTTTGISLTNKQLIVSANKNVVIINTSGDIKVGGNDGLIQVTNGGSLAIYTSGDVVVGGQGIANGTPSGTSDLTAAQAQQPKNFQIWGTSTTSQSIDIKGKGALSAVVYAPAGDVFVNGNGDVMGSVVAANVTMVGNAAFHYDESLGDFDGNSPYGISKWTELTTATERADYSAKLNF
jgi:hypothetical protein